MAIKGNCIKFRNNFIINRNIFVFTGFISISMAPVIQGLFKPLATTAAWLVSPPLEVNIPSDACMALISLVFVSIRINIDFSSLFLILFIPSISKATKPDTTPGDAEAISFCGFLTFVNHQELEPAFSIWASLINFKASV